MPSRHTSPKVSRWLIGDDIRADRAAVAVCSCGQCSTASGDVKHHGAPTFLGVQDRSVGQRAGVGTNAAALYVDGGVGVLHQRANIDANHVRWLATPIAVVPRSSGAG